MRWSWECVARKRTAAAIPRRRSGGAADRLHIGADASLQIYSPTVPTNCLVVHLKLTDHRRNTFVLGEGAAAVALEIASQCTSGDLFH